DSASRLDEEEHPGPSELESALTYDTLAEVVTQVPIVLDAATSLAETIRRMQQERRACVLLVEDGKLAGIFTERDVLMKVAEGTPVSACMTRDPVTLPADSTVAYALNLMAMEGFRHIPMVDDDGHPRAVVSMRNLIEYLGEFYGRDVVNLPPDPRQGRFKSRE